MSHAECLAQHASTGLAKGARRPDGDYYRCLRGDDVKRLYRDDADGACGYRVRPEKWRWRDQDQEEGLSVIDASCARGPRCAIHFHPDADEFEHVVKIDLAALSKAIGVALAAIFDPVVEPPENPCHFVILPTDASIDDLLVSLSEFMADDFPPGRKMPRREPALSQAREARERYDLVFEIIRDVMDP